MTYRTVAGGRNSAHMSIGKSRCTASYIDGLLTAFHTSNTTHHIVKSIGHAHDAERLIQTLKSLYDITAEWEGELYCGLTLAWDDAPRPAICSDTVFSSDPGPVRQLPSNSCHRTLVPPSSAWCLRLLPIYMYVYFSCRYWDPRNYTICSNTDFSFDPGPAQ
jgi:hypothetical protein